MRTESYVKDHSEVVAQLRLGFPFGELAINSGHGNRVRFESEDFNRAFTVRAPDERFAYDVIHPQTMEWLLAQGAYPFVLAGGLMMFEVEDTSVETLEGCLAFAAGLFGRVRNYTWENLGLKGAPIAPAVGVGQGG